jgi:signal transduction histidine kinase/CheY-like chemotaxis protein
MIKRKKNGKGCAFMNISRKKGRMRCGLAVLCLCLALFWLLPAVPAQAQRTIRIGYIDYDGFIIQQEDGRYAGYGVDYLNELSKYTGWKYEYVYDTWLNQLQALKEGKIDFLCHAQKTPQREQDYLFSKYSDGSETNVLYAREEDNSFCYEDYASFDGKKVAFLQDSFQNEEFSAYAALNGFTYTACEYPTEMECFEALKKGEVDLVAMGSLASKTGYKVAARFGSDPFYFITGKENQALVDELDLAKGQLMGQKPSFQYELFEQYYGSSAANTSLLFTREEIEYIQNAKPITVGQLRNRYPISSFEEKTGKLAGINEDILARISEMSGLQFTSMPIPLDAKPIDVLKAGDYDLVMGIMNCEEFRSDEALSLTEPFMESVLAMVTRKGESFDDTQHYTVALKKSFQAMQQYIQTQYPQFSTRFYSSDEECLSAVLNGEADIMMQNVYVTNYLLQKPQYENLEILPTTFLKEENCIAARSDTDPRLISILNRCIAHLPEEEKNSIVLANTTAKPYHMTLTDVAYKYRLPAGLVGIMLIFCAALFIRFNVMRQRHVKAMELKNTQLHEAVAQAEEANCAKSLFLSRMSHEIRTPMNAILGITFIAKAHKREPEKIEDCLNKIESASRVLLNIINDVLDMSAIESQKLRIASAEFDMKQVLSAITSIYYAQCKAKNVTFTVAADLPEELLIGDQLRVNQILLNLISNAYKFTEAGDTIRVLVSEKQRRGDTVFLQFVVADTGCGMTPEMQERLFQPFEQESATTAQKHGGSGLGMSITKNLVDMMHGAIRVESEKGKGTTFTVELPFGVSKNKAEFSRSLQDLHAMVVDDDPSTREYMGCILKRIGVHYEMAGSGREAIALLEKSKKEHIGYDICFVDWKMPDINGVDVVRKIRETGTEQKPMILVASAYDISEGMEEAKAAGADMVLAKPLFQSTIFNLLMQISGEKHAVKENENIPFDFSGHRLLLAEDNDLNAEIAQELLGMVHMEADRAENGKAALELFEKAPEGTYDLILMDMQMPEMDGLEATRRIRALPLPWAKRIPIFAMTANAFTQDVAAALSAGMNGHIAKPIDTKMLYQTLQKAVSKES